MDHESARPRVKVVEAQWAADFEEKINQALDELVARGCYVSDVDYHQAEGAEAVNAAPYLAIINYLEPPAGKRYLVHLDGSIEVEGETIGGTLEQFDLGSDDLLAELCARAYAVVLLRRGA